MPTAQVAARLRARLRPRAGRRRKSPRRAKLIREHGLCLLLPGAASTPTSSFTFSENDRSAAFPRRPPISYRRDFLKLGGTGLGGIALAALLARAACARRRAHRSDRSYSPEQPLAPRAPHFAPKAKNVSVIFCSGALSHVDTLDYKPELIKRHGQPMPGADELVTFRAQQGNLIKPLWEFKPRGQSGKMISDLLPHLAELADDMCFIHSMTAKSNTHGPAENQMSTGFTLDGFPEHRRVGDLRAGHRESGPAGVRRHPRSARRAAGRAEPLELGVPARRLSGHAVQRRQADPEPRDAAAISAAGETRHARFPPPAERRHLAEHPGDTELAARIASYELAARMQLSAAGGGRPVEGKRRALARSTASTTPNALKAGFARNCLLARRLLERGVRFVQLFNGAYAMGEGVGNWDGHKTLKEQYDIHAPILDQPGAALLTRPRSSAGLLEDTLVAFVTEFGRMPTFQKGANGRDHNPNGFTVWLAGAGVKRGFSYGATDEFGYKAVENVATIYDLHATILHLLGLDHERLSFYHNGIERRLTDVHGEVIHGVLA